MNESDKKNGLELELVVAVSKDGYIGYRDIKNNQFRIPWRIPLDLKRFQELTMSKVYPLVSNSQNEKDNEKEKEKEKEREKGKEKVNVVIMGRHTWESLPVSPLRQRINIVITRSESILTTKLESCKPLHSFDVKQPLTAGLTLTAPTLESVVQFLSHPNRGEIGRIFVIGGFLLYAEAMTRSDCTTLHVTGIHKEVGNKTDENKTWIRFPPIPVHYSKTMESHVQVIEQTSNDVITMSMETWKRT